MEKVDARLQKKPETDFDRSCHNKTIMQFVFQQQN